MATMTRARYNAQTSVPQASSVVGVGSVELFQDVLAVPASNSYAALSSLDVVSRAEVLVKAELLGEKCLVMTLEEYLSLLDIYNVAFTQLGVPNINQTTDTVSQALIANNNWPLFKEQFLNDHSWNGAKKTAALSNFLNSDDTVVTPVARWRHGYKVPDDYVRGLRLNGEEMRPVSKHMSGTGLWEEEILTNDIGTHARCIVTNSTTASLEYTFLLCDAEISLLTGLTRYAMSLSFAAFLSSKFGKPASEKAQLEALAEEALRKARRADSSIGSNLTPPNMNLIWARM